MASDLPADRDRSHFESVMPDGAGSLEVAARSDRGPVRRENQDAWAVMPLAGLGGGATLCLADGMGGHEDGAVAGFLAVEAASTVLARAGDPHSSLGAAVRAEVHFLDGGHLAPLLHLAETWSRAAAAARARL